ncbi:hypothetical protein AAFF_G00001220 [Aldrovandia affinis]|uniref:Uncharacterized protein n=1 Tax=Aldrovandia affinis TaxID=143900 RepID=A0AAD7TEA4_9TELE|nr:hypothetical protein AAFF_G00001220 [Aldrovandia affinis]
MKPFRFPHCRHMHPSDWTRVLRGSDFCGARHLPTMTLTGGRLRTSWLLPYSRGYAIGHLADFQAEPVLVVHSDLPYAGTSTCCLSSRCADRQTNIGATLLYLVCQEGHLTVVEYLVKDCGVDILGT